MLVYYLYIVRRVYTGVGPYYTGRSVHLALCLRSTNFTICFIHMHTHASQPDSRPAEIRISQYGAWESAF